MNKSLEEQRQAEDKRLNKYKRTFKKSPGKDVLDDLKDRYLLHGLQSETLAANNNPLGMAYIAGQRELILRLVAWIETPNRDLLDARFGPEENDPHGGQSIIRRNTSGIITTGDPLADAGAVER